MFESDDGDLPLPIVLASIVFGCLAMWLILWIIN
jgi:hypothetical protein